MSTVAIIQARMNSSRLPGKVLMNLAGKSVLSHVILRLSKSNLLDDVIVATSVENTDDPIEVFCTQNSVKCFRGSLDDVLDRFYTAAKKYHISSIVRITADCPLIDPTIVDKVIEGFHKGNYDCYGLSGEFPDGLDCTVFSFMAIERAWKEAKLDSEREHVGPYIEKNPEIFKNGGLKLYEGLQNKRWTLDQEEDYLLLSSIFNALSKDDNIFLTQDVLDYLEINPEVELLNCDIIRNEGYQNSIKKEKIVD
jgi:spore coat polysaccharide biosynthesis protein SpsF (cytidylyltransferase family)